MSKLSEWKMMCLAMAGVALSSLAANVVRADSLSDQAAKLDIVGVHIGMTPAQAKSVLSQYRKGMQWRESQRNLGISEGQFVVEAIAQWAPFGSENVSVVFSPPPGDPKVVAVTREVSFDESQAPTVEGLSSSLTDKFGQPSYKSSPTFIWAWDKTGQVSKANQADTCNVYNNQRQFLLASWVIVPQLQQENDDGCAIVVQAVIHSGSSGIADHLEMTLIDVHDALQAAIATNNHIKQVEQAKKEEALKKASANKPAL